MPGLRSDMIEVHDTWRAPGSRRHFGFLVLPGFSMIAFTNAIEPLRMANQLAGGELYRWSVYSMEGGAVIASDGLTAMPTRRVDEAALPEVLLVCGGADGPCAPDEELARLLRRLAQRGVALGALCSGVSALAGAKLLDGYRSAARWEDLSGMRERFPRIECTPNLFVVDRDRYTCTGGVAALDFMLYLITPRIGRALAAAISEMLGVERVRDETDRQRIPLAGLIGGSRPLVSEAVQLMEANIEEPLTLEDIARLSGVSQRQLQRVFRSTVGLTPARYYITLRLRCARDLLKQTPMSVIEVTLACGFRSACHFSRAYRAFFGHAPSHERRLSRVALRGLSGDATAAGGVAP